MIPDEIVYLVATRGSGADYVSALSLCGALVFIALGLAALPFTFLLGGRRGGWSTAP